MTDIQGRRCGRCTLCCKLLPVVELKKAAGERCDHQRHGKGCAIYAERPMACRLWTCGWLVIEATAGLPRPDRAHYVIDTVPDYVTMTSDGQSFRVPVMQVWVDPQHRDAWRQADFREFMAEIALNHGAATIIRFSSVEAVTVFPPALASDGEWHEMTGEIEPRNELDRAVLALAAG